MTLHELILDDLECGLWDNYNGLGMIEDIYYKNHKYWIRFVGNQSYLDYSELGIHETIFEYIPELDTDQRERIIYLIDLYKSY